MSSYRVKLMLALSDAAKGEQLKKGYKGKAEVLAKLDAAENALFAERAKIIEDRIRPGDDPQIKVCRALETEVTKVHIELAAVDSKLYAQLGSMPDEMATLAKVVDEFTAS